MKTKVTLWVFLLQCTALLTVARAQSTAFTYQGRLNNNGAPVSGNYDFQFAVYDANAAGNLVAGPLTVNSISVTVGLFVTRLDFGAGVFTGPGRWLQISFRPAGNGNFSTLDPRLELTSSPYAIRAQAAGVADSFAAGAVVKSLNGLHDDVTLAAGANVTLTPNGNTITLSAVGGGAGSVWSVSGNNVYYTAGKVGIGTSNPASLLDLQGSQDAFHITGYEPFMTFYDTNHSSARSSIQSVNGSLNFFTDSYLKGTDLFGFMLLAPNGNVGIGSSQPVGKLEVVAQDALRMIGYQPFLTFYDSNAGYAAGRIQSVGGGVGQYTDAYVKGSDSFGFMVLA
ncbi:MAG TPA: hypothetical protein VKY92_21225, partial [Verrucomicrobiae bacterium]|nr:hypothetical protein [Verrucomicrobiae bacterium]